MACCSQLVTPAAYANAADAVVPMRFLRTRLNSQFVPLMLVHHFKTFELRTKKCVGAQANGCADWA